MEGEVEPVPAAPLLPSDVKYDEKKMLLHKLDRCGLNLKNIKVRFGLFFFCSLSLLLYTFLLTLTVVTIWVFKVHMVK